MGRGAHGHSHSHGQSHGESHGHSHDHGGKFCGCCHLSNRTRLGCMLFLTFSFFVVELIVGQITKSIALTTDSFHMLSDALALIIGLFSNLIAGQKNHNINKNTFGWVRAEILGGLINSVFLVSLCLGMLLEAVERLFETKEIEDPKLLLVVGLIGLAINLLGLFIFGHAHSHSLPKVIDNDDQSDDETDNFIQKLDNSEQKKPKSAKCHILSKEANMNMRAVFLHVLADALGSVIVVLSALVNIYQQQLHIPRSVISFIDPSLCLVLVILILCSTLPLLKESALILLQTVPKEIELGQLKDEIEKKIQGVISVHELHVWRLSGNKIIATAHIKCHNSVEYMKVAADLKKLFHKYNIHSTTIQPEFSDSESVEKNCILECKTDCNPNTCCGQLSPSNTQQSANQLALNMPNEN